MSPEAARDGDEVVLRLESFEVDLLRSLPAALRSLLDDPDPDDPAVARLFPACVIGDDEVDAEVRRLIHDDVLRSRLEALDTFVDVLQRGQRRRGQVTVRLVEDEPAMVLGVLNDVRLTLGARIGIEHLDRDEIGRDHPAVQTLAVMDHLAWIQEEILRAIDPSAADVEE
jgi:hypothetical protein